MDAHSRLATRAAAYKVLGVRAGAALTPRAARGAYRRAAARCHPDGAVPNVMAFARLQDALADVLADLEGARDPRRGARDNDEANAGEYAHSEEANSDAMGADADITAGTTPSSPTALAEAARKKGNAAYAAGDAASAVELYAEALSWNPRDASAHSNLSAAALAVGDAAVAVRAAESAAALRPTWAKAHYRLGKAAGAAGDNAASAVAYRRAIEIEPALADGEAGAALALAEAAAAGDACRAVLIGHRATVYAAAFAPGGRLLATASLDGTARLWDATTGLCMRALAGHEDKVTHVAWAPAGRQLLATASVDRSVRLWDCVDIGAGVACVAVLAGHEGRPTSLSWGASHVAGGEDAPALHLVTSSTDGTARLWVEDVPAGAASAANTGENAKGAEEGKPAWRCARVYRPGREGILPCAAYEPCERLVAAVSSKAVDMWHVKLPTRPSEEELSTQAARGECALAEATDNRESALVADCSIEWREDGLVHHAAWSPPAQLNAYAGGTGSARRVLATCHYKGEWGSGRVLVWDAAKLRGGAPAAPCRRLENLRGKAECVHFAAMPSCEDGGQDCVLMSVACSDGTVRVFDVGEGVNVLELVDEHSLGPNKAASVLSCALCVRGNRVLLATGGIDGRVKVFDGEEGTRLASLPAGTGHVKALAWSPAGDALVSAGTSDGGARLWDASKWWE